MKRPLSATLAGITGGLLLASTAPLVATPAEAVSDAARDYSRDAVAATNNARDREDRVQLGGHGCLQKYARRQARRMAAEEEIWHQNLRRVLRDCTMSFVGENVAAGFPNGYAVVNNGWMRSEGHRENILEPRFRRVAVAARKGDDGRWYAAQVFGRPD